MADLEQIEQLSSQDIESLYCKALLAVEGNLNGWEELRKITSRNELHISYYTLIRKHDIIEKGKYLIINKTMKIQKEKYWEDMMIRKAMLIKLIDVYTTQEGKLKPRGEI